MPTGLRAADAPLIQRLTGGDLKLLLRLGALLQERLAVTEAALQAIVSEDRTGLLTDRGLMTVDASGFASLCAAHSAEDLVLTFAPDGWRVIALADEVGNPLLAALMPVPEPESTGLPAVVANLSPAMRGPVEGLLAARADDQRAAALEQLRYAMPPLTVVGELMPLLLADGADIVRERAIALLVASGAHVAVVDTIRALQRGDEQTLLRQADSLSRLPAPQQELAISATIAQLARGQASPGLVAVACALAPRLASHPGLERLIELLLPRRLSLLDLVRALQDHDRIRLDAILARNLGVDPEQDAQLIVLLAAPSAPPAGHILSVPALLERGVFLLLAPDAAPRERMALAAALRRLDAFQTTRTLAGLIADREMSLGKAFDTSVYWLLADLCRDGAVSPDIAERLALTCRRLLREAGGPHLISLLEQQLPALLPATLATRVALVEPVVETVARFHDDRSRDVAAACVLALGAPALAELWSSLADHPRLEVRELCAQLVPELLTRTGAEVETARDGVERLLTLLNRTTDTTERAALATAAARIAVAPVLAADGLLQGRVLAATNGLGDRGFEALGHLAASPACNARLREDLLTRMLHALSEQVPDAPAQSTTEPGDDEVTWVLDDALTRHTDAIPRVLRALERIGTADGLPAEIGRLICERLCKQWRLVSTWQMVWGPGNIRELGETIGRLADRPACPAPQRVLAAESLLIAANQLAIARVLARIFIAGEGTYLATLAGRAAARLVQLAAEDYYADDERPDLVEVLVDYLAVRSLGKEDDTVKRRIVNLIATLQSHLSARARLRLRYLRGELPPELAVRIDWA